MADSPQETLALARTAAGAVRSLNHATLGGDGLAQPADESVRKIVPGSDRNQCFRRSQWVT